MQALNFFISRCEYIMTFALSNIIEVTHLKKYFPISNGIFSSLRPGKKKYKKAVDDVTLKLPRGKALVVVGESGSGKTTLARLILRSLDADSGSIVFNGFDITHKSGRQLRYFRSKVQMIHQDPYTSLDPRMTVLNIVMEPLDVFCNYYSKKERAEITLKTMEAVFLDPVVETSMKFPHMLSGGQRQRVALARALVIMPELIIADEAVSMLDVSIRAEILQLMKNLSIRRRITYLYITHDLATSKYIGDDLAVMYSGKIVEMGKVYSVLSKPLHPYTQALIQAVSEPDPSNLLSQKLISINSTDKRSPDKGCNFYNKCKYSMDICRITPSNKAVDPDHFVSCYLHT
jgi:peptide/nickel transport system ATP-binding protein